MKKAIFTLIALFWLITVGEKAHAIPRSASFSAGQALVLRDPFQPLETIHCQDAQVPPTWRLRGVIGAQTQWIGWLSTPEHSWLKIRMGDRVQSTPWRVIQLNHHAIGLENTIEERACVDSQKVHLIAAPLRPKGPTEVL